MPFSAEVIDKKVEEVQQQVIQPSFDKVTNSEKFDILFVIMIVLLMFAFKNVTAFIMKMIGALIIGLGIYALVLT